MERGDYASAAAELNGILIADSTRVQALRLLASAYLHLEASLPAIQACYRILEVDSTDTGVMLTLGYLNQRQGDLVLAETYYQRAITLDPGLVQAYQGLGWIYIERRQLGDAQKVVARCAEIAPRYGPNYVLMGRVLTAQGFFESAREAYERAFRLDPVLRERYGVLSTELALRHRLVR